MSKTKELDQQAGEALFNRLGTPGDITLDVGNLNKLFMYTVRHMTQRAEGVPKEAALELESLSLTVENLSHVLQQAEPLQRKRLAIYEKEYDVWAADVKADKLQVLKEKRALGKKLGELEKQIGE